MAHGSNAQTLPKISVLNPKLPRFTAPTGESYFAASLSTLKHLSVFPADLYLLHNGNHLTQLYNRNAEVSPNALDNLSSKGISQLWFAEGFLHQYLTCLEDCALQIMRSPNLSGARKIAVLFDLMCISLSEIYSTAGKEKGASIQRVSRLAGSMVQFVSKDVMTLSVLLSMVKNEPGMVRHALSTGVLSMLLASQTEFNTDRDLLATGLGGILHDIGLTLLPTSLMEKDPVSMNTAEMKLYREHPTKGSALLEPLDRVSRDVKKIILQHHEKPNGRGYPLGVSANDISPLARIVSIADSFTDFTQSKPGPHGRKGVHPHKALDLMATLRGSYDSTLLARFTKLFLPRS